MQKTKIEWTDYSWNPIKGICPTGCWYCYAKRMYKRFGWNPKIEIDPNELVNPYRLNKPSKIFLCSTIELFHPDIPKFWRTVIFTVVIRNPHHTFQILTKFPQNIDREMPDNVWLGVTITRPSEMNRWTNLYFHQRANLKFVSFEPLMEQLDSYPSSPDWIIIGRLTGHGRKYDPKKEWVEEIVKQARKINLPIFLKDNLIGIWGEPLIQEFPCVA